MNRTKRLMLVAAVVVAGAVLAMRGEIRLGHAEGQSAAREACAGCDSDPAKPFAVREVSNLPQATGAISVQHGGHTAVHADFDSDARSDLVLEHPANGWLAYWNMSGVNPVAYSPVLVAPPSYRRVATSDFTGDGRADIMWHRFGLDLLLWVADGAGGFRQVAVAPQGPLETIAVIGADDVDGDGKSDLLISTESGRSFAYLIMDGAVITRRSPAMSRPEGHRAVAFGDFNGDLRVDIVWKAANSRSLLMWLGDGVGFAPAPIRDYAPGWEVWGAGQVDADGKADLLLTHRSSRLFAYWAMDGAAVLRYSQVFRLPGDVTPNSRFGPITAGDYNGDGLLDIVHSRERDQSLVMWLGDGAGFTEWPMRRHTPGWRVAPRFGRDGAPVRPYVPGDTNGDGRAELIVNNLNPDTMPATWSAFSNYYVFDGSGWQLDKSVGIAGGQPLASGDIDADGRLDLLMERANPDGGARQTLIALSSLTEPDVQYAEIPTPAASWRIVGADDVDGDGRSDILLGQGVADAFVGGEDYRNPTMQGFAYWVMDHARVVRYSIGFRTDPIAPRLAAKGDFNGDGRLDLVWSSVPGASEPQLRMWLGDGNGFASVTLPAPTPGWNVVAAADVDGDGVSDLFLKHRDGMAYWLMDAARIRGYSPGFLLPGNQHVADINGDGRSDILRLEPVIRTNFNVSSVIMHFGDGSGFQAASSAGGVGHTGFDALGRRPALIFTR